LDVISATLKSLPEPAKAVCLTDALTGLRHSENSRVALAHFHVIQPEFEKVPLQKPHTLSELI
jgi:hypothetical protein